jgi:hypothetical protein
MYGGQTSVPYDCTYLLAWGWWLKVNGEKTKKLRFYATKISRCAVALQIPGGLGSPGYKIDPHNIPNPKHSLLILIGSIWGLLDTSKVRICRVAMMTQRSDQQGDMSLHYYVSTL